MNRLKFLLALALTGAVMGAHAEESREQRIARMMGVPETEIEVRPLASTGMMEVVHTPSKLLVYVDPTLHYLIQGPVLDPETRRNLTQERVDELNSIDWSALPFHQAIKIVKGDGSRRMALFADPDCPFCRQLEEMLFKVDNVTIHLFLYPIAELHPDAPARARDIWCADDPAAAWRDYLLQGTEPPRRDCPTPIEALQPVGRKIAGSGTPTVVFEDGKVVAGVMPMARLEAEFKRAAERLANSGSPGTDPSAGAAPVR